MDQIIRMYRASYASVISNHRILTLQRRKSFRVFVQASNTRYCMYVNYAFCQLEKETINR